MIPQACSLWNLNTTSSTYAAAKNCSSEANPFDTLKDFISKYHHHHKMRLPTKINTAREDTQVQDEMVFKHLSRGWTQESHETEENQTQNLCSAIQWSSTLGVVVVCFLWFYIPVKKAQ